ncbi:hypothetical protein TNCV_4869011 [Trichonephila clavipes]|nr:hypothetical protein TNCV_4869011 [Trichonephila clavipes]
MEGENEDHMLPQVCSKPSCCRDKCERRFVRPYYFLPLINRPGSLTPLYTTFGVNICHKGRVVTFSTLDLRKLHQPVAVFLVIKKGIHCLQNWRISPTGDNPSRGPGREGVLPMTSAELFPDAVVIVTHPPLFPSHPPLSEEDHRLEKTPGALNNF